MRSRIIYPDFVKNIDGFFDQDCFELVGCFWKYRNFARFVVPICAHRRFLPSEDFKVSLQHSVLTVDVFPFLGLFLGTLLFGSYHQYHSLP